MQSFLGFFFGNALKYTQVLYREESQANPYYGPICIVSANENNGQEIINRIDFSFLINTYLGGSNFKVPFALRSA